MSKSNEPQIKPEVIIVDSISTLRNEQKEEIIQRIGHLGLPIEFHPEITEEASMEKNSTVSTFVETGSGLIPEGATVDLPSYKSYKSEANS